MIIKRDRYLKKIIQMKGKKMIKVVTGIRRCGKSFLLFHLFKDHLLSSGIPASHIIGVTFDDIQAAALRDPKVCYEYIRAQIKDGEMYYVLLDEVQMLPGFEEVLNSLMHIPQVDLYVTGSNSKFLSSDIITELRGRGYEIHVYPLTFSEYYSAAGGDWEEAWNDYEAFGGLPFLLELPDEEAKIQYLQTLFKETYIKDIVERNHFQHERELEDLVRIVGSAIGSFTNPQKLSNAFRSGGSTLMAPATVKRYLNGLEEAFLIARADRYDVKGKKYISTLAKYYFEDVGIRNAVLHFRQQEETHLMENILYNELRARGYAVDVGVVNIREKNEMGQLLQKQIEIDFVVNRGSERYYIQSAWRMENEGKRNQEMRPLIRVDDSFKKFVIVRDNVRIQRNEAGITTMGLKQFLLDPNSLGK